MKLSDELQQLIEVLIQSTVRGIENTLEHILHTSDIRLSELNEVIQQLEQSFALLSQKWILQILYILLLQSPLGFNDFKRILSVNSRSLSDKLTALRQQQYITRIVQPGPPLRTHYSITSAGRQFALLALPLLYYSMKPR